MVVGVVRAELHLPESHSLKEKRSVLKSLKDRMRRKFNVAVAEVDPQETWQRAALGVAAVGSERAYVERQLQEIVQWLRDDRGVAVMHVEQEWW